MRDADVDSSLPFLQGSGEMAARTRALDWSRTAVGPPERWPQSLRSTLSMLLPSKAQIVLFWGPEFIVFYNDAYRPVFGAKHPHVLGRPGRDAWSEIWDSVLHELLAGVVRTGEAFWAKDMRFELERFGFAEETYFDVSYDPVRVESGNVGGVFCIVTETTERVIGERRLSLLRDLAAHNAAARTAAMACALAADTLATSPADITFALIQLEGELPSGTPNAERLGAAADPRLIQRLPLVVAGKETGTLIVGLNPKRPLDDQYQSFLHLVADQLSTAIANARAYEEEARRAAALAELDRAKTAFFSNVSHEFRTPLTLLMGPIQDLLADDTLPPATARRLTLAHHNALRLLRLVNTLLDFSRIEAGRIDASYEPTDLARFTTELASNFRSAIEAGGVTFAVTCPSGGEAVYVDRGMWEKIVFNLLSNAFKFTLAGRIEVSLTQAEGWARLQVRDTGSGIPRDELPHLFERFHRVKGTTARSHEGTGIGLALVQELARLHAGDVSVESTPGAGSTFTVRIPLGRAHLPADRVAAASTDPPAAVTAAAFVEEVRRWLPGESPATTAGGVRVLVADDNADMREYLTHILGDRYQVETVANGMAALSRMREAPPDLVVSDVMMPMLDGFGLVAAIRGDERLRTIPVILLSARAGEEARIEGLAAGADDYMVKPFSARELLASVASQLTLTEVRRQSQAARVRAAEHASQMKDDFVASLSHELRTPLSAIVGYTRMLRTGAIAPERQHKAFETLERSAASLTQIVEDVLDMSRIVSGKIRLNLQPVDLAQLVRNAVDAVEPVAAAAGVKLEVALDAAGLSVSGDPDRLQQVLWNLLSNAVKFTGRGGRVRVSGRHEDGRHAVLNVEDSGVGIPPEFLPHVFDRFRQGDTAAIPREQGGLGLGLSIARDLVEMHGGRITAASDGPGRGATFTMRLPLRSA